MPPPRVELACDMRCTHPVETNQPGRSIGVIGMVPGLNFMIYNVDSKWHPRYPTNRKGWLQGYVEAP